jgi:hypothetical protein
MKYAHVSRLAKIILQAVCVRGYLRILLAWEKTREERRGEEMEGARWWVEV